MLMKRNKAPVSPGTARLQKSGEGQRSRQPHQGIKCHYYTFLQTYFLHDVEILPADSWAPIWPGAVAGKRRVILSDLETKNFIIILATSDTHSSPKDPLQSGNICWWGEISSLPTLGGLLALPQPKLLHKVQTKDEINDSQVWLHLGSH